MKDGEEIKRAYYRLYDHIRRRPHSPGDMKEYLIRFNMALLNVYKTQWEIESELEIQRCMQAIAAAMSWREVRIAMDRFLSAMKFDAFEEEEDAGLEPACPQGGTDREKILRSGDHAGRSGGQAFISEEYLSSQFKKETGAGFAETIRRYRIERIKGSVGRHKA